MIIGIAGGSGSGKTTLTKKLRTSFPNDIAVLEQDNYYKRNDELTLEQRSKINYDSPEAFDGDLFIEHLKKLINGENVEEPQYDYTIHNRKGETTTIVPKKIIIVEGILIFTNPALCDLMDIKIFVDTDDDIRLKRRIKRDIEKRGRTVDSVLTQWEETVKPMYDKYVRPSKANADIVLLEGGNNRVIFDLLSTKIRTELNT